MVSFVRKAVAVVLVLQLSAIWGVAVGDITEDVCPLSELVYPLNSVCGSGTEGAALYFGQEVYELGLTSFAGSILGRLTPEWDETNSTFYVRSAGVGAKYKFTYMTKEYRGVVAQGDSLYIVNAETERYLGWRKEGENEWFLVEVDSVSTNSSVVYFQFSRAPFNSFPLCNKFIPGEILTCEAYYILKAGTSMGVSPYVEDGVIYFQLATVPTFNFPLSAGSFLLLRATPSSVSLA